MTPSAYLIIEWLAIICLTFSIVGLLGIAYLHILNEHLGIRTVRIDGQEVNIEEERTWWQHALSGGWDIFYRARKTTAVKISLGNALVGWILLLMVWAISWIARGISLSLRSLRNIARKTVKSNSP